jgi:hypothetical protein
MVFIPADRIDDYVERNNELPPGVADANARATKARKISEARKSYRNAVDRIDDGKSLKTFYNKTSHGTYDGVSGNYTKIISTLERWGSGINKTKLKISTPEIRAARYVNTREYLNFYFPTGFYAGPHGIIWYFSATSGVGSESQTIPKQKTDSTVIKKTGTWWKEKLRDLDMVDRLPKIDSTLNELRETKRLAERALTSLGVSASEFYQAKSSTANDNSPKPPQHNYDNDAIEYNVGMVNEAYFATEKGFAELANLMTGGNRPSAVDTGNDLWKNSKSNKGMIWLYNGPGDDDITYEDVEKQGANDTFRRYAFQFHYNPTTVQQAWSGSPDVDITMYTSGRAKYNLLGGQTQSTVTFTLTLNRMFDLQYYGTDGLLKPNRRNERNPYSPMKPNNDAQQRIYNYGTMYDLEYLLATILGIKFKSRFRGETSDIGFLTGRPVDLHLGNKLRYWGYISNISVNHVIFDERMVPILSEVNVTFARIPDYQASS